MVVKACHAVEEDGFECFIGCELGLGFCKLYL